ncbi:MAG: RNA 2',3'-cyclic phosphodiesterase [Bacteroidia bacterium]
MRVFIGLPTPPEANAWILQNRPPLLPAAARWLPVDTWHMTLCFIGEKTEEDVLKIHELVEPILQGHDYLSLRPTHIGWKGRTLWVHLDTCPILEKTVKRLHEALGMPFTGPFRPHITIARARIPLRWQGSWEVRPVRFTFTVGYLYQSILRPEGAEYRPLYRYLFRYSPEWTVF